jgi:hypothetical protein
MIRRGHRFFDPSRLAVMLIPERYRSRNLSSGANNPARL